MNSYKEVARELQQVTEKLKARPKDPALLRATCHLMLESARYLEPNNHDLAQKYIQRTVQVAKELAENNGDADLTDPESDAVGDLKLLASAYFDLVTLQTDDPAAALDSAELLVTVRSTLAEAHLKTPSFWSDIAAEAAAIGSFAKEHGDDRATSFYRLAIGAEERLTSIADDPTEHYEHLAHLLADLAWHIRRTTSQGLEAADLMTRALSIRRALAAVDPTNPERQCAVICCLGELAEIVEPESPARTLALFKESAALSTRQCAANPEHTMLLSMHAEIHERLAKALGLENHNQATAAFEEAVAATRTVLGVEPDSIARSQALGHRLRQLAEHIDQSTEDTAAKMVAIEEAYSLTRVAVDAEPDNRLYVADHVQATTRLAEWVAGDEPQRVGRLLAEAEPLARKLCDIPVIDAVALCRLGEVLALKAYHMAECRPDQAESAFDEALIVHDRLTDTQPGNNTWQQERGRLLSTFGTYSFMPNEKAMSLLEEAVRVYEWLLREEPENLWHYGALSHTLIRLGRRTEDTDVARSQVTYVKAVSVLENAMAARPGDDACLELCGITLSAAADAIIGSDQEKAATWIETSSRYLLQLLSQDPQNPSVRFGYGLNRRMLAKLHNPCYQPDGDWQLAQSLYAAALQHLNHVIQQGQLVECFGDVEDTVDEVQHCAESYPLSNVELMAALVETERLATDLKAV